jgi:hypothetical protein
VIYQNNCFVGDRCRSVAGPVPKSAPRCEYAQEKCVTSEITLREVAPGHFSACLRIQLKEMELAPMHLPDEVFASK